MSNDPDTRNHRRMLILGDGLALTTGFAQVIRHTAAAFRAAGWELAQIASLDPPPDCDSRPYYAAGVRPFFPGASEPTGLGLLSYAVEQFRPDVLFCVSDPGQAHNWQRQHAALESDTDERAQPQARFVLYAPVEGAPVCPPYVSAFRYAQAHGAAATVTGWAAGVLHDEAGIDVPAISHGVDRDVWKPLAPHERDRLRRRLGWEGKFVLAYVARNAGRKSQDRLIKALAHLRGSGYDMRDVLLYLHCTPFDSYQLQGWDLVGLAHWCGVSDSVQFPEQTDATRGEAQMSLAQKLACADLYVHPAQVEGFGLPILEAMACGLPVAIPEDHGNMQEVGGRFALTFDVLEESTWFNGAQLVNVAPRLIASRVWAWRSQPELLAQARRKSTQRAADPRFRWQTMTDALQNLVAYAVTAPDVERLLAAAQDDD